MLLKSKSLVHECNKVVAWAHTRSILYMYVLLY
jgi:hypothetical protein